MSATNTTTYYEFPVFVGSDKPAWLVDWNGAMNAIDSAIHEAKAEADANASSITSLQSDVTSLAGSVSSQGSSITTLTQSLTNLQGTVNTITSLIGNGEPTTDDKTIIGAINELKADIDAIAPSGDLEAEDVAYDNTTSGLTADDVQSAIDEINAKIPQGGSVDADDVVYDNTQSGLTATDVQSAIDELAQGSNDWVLAGTSTGTTAVNVSASAKEFLVFVYYEYSQNVNVAFSISILKAFGSARFGVGGYSGTSQNPTSGKLAEVDYDATNNTIALLGMYVDGATRTSTTSIKVFQR